MCLVISMKKIISFSLAFVMIFTIFSVISFATEKVKLSIKNETVYAGDEFTVSLFISDNSKMSGAVIDVFYDEGALEYVSSKQGAILDEYANISIKNISVGFQRTQSKCKGRAVMSACSFNLSLDTPELH